ncbi:MAG TPA: ester cyclase [Promineifilum sp.]|nr:ester cyclase [Promineifilum sp.]
MDPIATLRAAHEAFSRHDLPSIIRDMRRDVVVYGHAAGQRLPSADAFAQFMNMYFTMSSDIAIVDAEYFAHGNKVVAQFRAVGTQDGPFLGFPASDRPFTLDVAEIWTFDDEGYAIEGHNYADTLGLLIQLGHVPAPALA